MIRVFLLLLSCIPIYLHAQWTTPCVDSNRINPFYQCNDPSFNPVCGCNNVTYRNGCEMTNVAGVNYAASDQNGVCRNDFFFYHFYPNPVVDRMNFSMQYAPQEVSTATMQIYDIFGNVVYFQLLNSFSDFPTTPQSITFTNLETGLYIMVIQSRGVFKISKFMKHTF